MKINENGVVRDMTPEEVFAFEAGREAYKASPAYKAAQSARLKKRLAETDYKALKYFEGWLSEEEYAPVRAERQALRDKINALESEVTV